MELPTLAIKITESSMQRLVEPFTVISIWGIEPMLTIMVSEVMHPLESVTVTKNSPPVVTVMDWVVSPVLQLISPSILAVKVMESPGHKKSGPIIITDGLRITTMVSEMVQSLEFVTVTKNSPAVVTVMD